MDAHTPDPNLHYATGPASDAYREMIGRLELLQKWLGRHEQCLKNRYRFSAGQLLFLHISYFGLPAMGVLLGFGLIVRGILWAHPPGSTHDDVLLHVVSSVMGGLLAWRSMAAVQLAYDRAAPVISAFMREQERGLEVTRFSLAGAEVPEQANHPAQQWSDTGTTEWATPDVMAPPVESSSAAHEGMFEPMLKGAMEASAKEGMERAIAAADSIHFSA